jgi:hypothetical protein
MNESEVLKHQFVEFIPEQLEEGTLYVSLRFGTASHLCCCGCGSKVVTPIQPAAWWMIFDGKTVTLDPSIGNWSFSCQSHYWIRRSKVIWAPKWSKGKIETARAYDKEARDKYFSGKPDLTEGGPGNDLENDIDWWRSRRSKTDESG